MPYETLVDMNTFKYIAIAVALVFVSLMVWVKFYPPALGEIGKPYTGQVIYVVDGDTFWLKTRDGKRKIRLSAVDAPETQQVHGINASTALWKKINRQTVTVHITALDDYGRLVGRVELGDRDISHEMVSEGHAWVHGQHSYADTLIAVEEAARQDGKGLWANKQPIPPWTYRHQG